MKAESAKGVFLWTEFLHSIKTGEDLSDLRGKRVVVIGGGSVAMDCPVSAKQVGAETVYIISLEGITELPADEEERLRAFNEGIIFKPRCRITSIQTTNGKVVGVTGIEIKWKKPDWFMPENAEDIPNTEFSLITDVIIEAIGTGFSQQAQELLSSLDRSSGVGLDLSIANMEGKFVKVDEKTFETSIRGIFAGGDIIHQNGSLFVLI